MSKNTKEIWKVVTKASELNIGDRVRYSDTIHFDEPYICGHREDSLRFVINIIDHMAVACDEEGFTMCDNIFDQMDWNKVEVCTNNKIVPKFLKKTRAAIKKTKEVKVLIHITFPMEPVYKNVWFEIPKNRISTVPINILSSNIYCRKADCIRAAKKVCKDLGLVPVFEIVDSSIHG